MTSTSWTMSCATWLSPAISSYPEEALPLLSGALENSPVTLNEAGYAARVRTALDSTAELVGSSPEALAAAVVRALEAQPAPEQGDVTETSSLPVEEPDRWRSLPWKLLPAVARPPLLNMALDEVLVERAGAGRRPPTLRIWGWSAPCVVLGRFQSVRNEVDEVAATRRGVEIVRRISGGGAMFIEPEGAITWSLYAPRRWSRG